MAPVDLRYVDTFFLTHFFSPQREIDSRTANIWKALTYNVIERMKGYLVGLSDFVIWLIFVLIFVWFCCCGSFLFVLVVFLFFSCVVGIVLLGFKILKMFEKHIKNVLLIAACFGVQVQVRKVWGEVFCVVWVFCFFKEQGR